jgi:hypothetical protein
LLLILPDDSPAAGDVAHPPRPRTDHARTRRGL